MNFLIDNNLPIQLAKALNELCEPEEVRVEHIREKFGEDAKDLDWIQQLQKEGGWAVVSRDRFNKNKLEKEAFHNSDITVFILSKGWKKLQYWDICTKLISKWPQLLKQTKLISKGGAFDVPVTGQKLNPTKL